MTFISADFCGTIWCPVLFHGFHHVPLKVLHAVKREWCEDWEVCLKLYCYYYTYWILFTSAFHIVSVNCPECACSRGLWKRSARSWLAQGGMCSSASPHRWRLGIGIGFSGNAKPQAVFQVLRKATSKCCLLEVPTHSMVVSRNASKTRQQEASQSVRTLKQKRQLLKLQFQECSPSGIGLPKPEIKIAKRGGCPFFSNSAHRAAAIIAPCENPRMAS